MPARWHSAKEPWRLWGPRVRENRQRRRRWHGAATRSCPMTLSLGPSATDLSSFTQHILICAYGPSPWNRSTAPRKRYRGSARTTKSAASHFGNKNYDSKNGPYRWRRFTFWATVGATQRRLSKN